VLDTTQPGHNQLCHLQKQQNALRPHTVSARLTRFQNKVQQTYLTRLAPDDINSRLLFCMTKQNQQRPATLQTTNISASLPLNPICRPSFPVFLLCLSSLVWLSGRGQKAVKWALREVLFVQTALQLTRAPAAAFGAMPHW
jgi:hypothetical protein